LEEASLLADAKARKASAIGVLMGMTSTPTANDLRDVFFHRLGEASAEVQLVGSPEVIAAHKQISIFLQKAVTAAEAGAPEFFDDARAGWLPLRQAFLIAARKELDLGDPPSLLLESEVDRESC
jgi:hypothetical protein